MTTKFDVPLVMTRDDLTAMILAAKEKAGLTWEEIAVKIGMSPV